ncbi:hypothetical protein CEXT_694581 [Caerostris extrusa]|uniref:Uncharacterized protein n=1 Tax=Caerostris extrusa TaxID=172846 RepID=A0AAV4TY61_CAEEX|nr:hypothetical protein CEXT_694581 [Caerostris extrusa]
MIYVYISIYEYSFSFQLIKTNDLSTPLPCKHMSIPEMSRIKNKMPPSFPIAMGNSSSQSHDNGKPVGRFSTYNKPCLEASCLYTMGDVPVPRNWGGKSAVWS